jgi:hypothetical protein
MDACHHEMNLIMDHEWKPHKPAMGAWCQPPGPQKELDMYPTFEVLVDLLLRPGDSTSMHILMVGPDVPEGMDSTTELLGTSCKHHLCE